MLSVHNGMSIECLSTIKIISLDNPDLLLPVPVIKPDKNKPKFLIAFFGAIGIPVIKGSELLAVNFGMIDMIPSPKNKKEIEHFMKENNIVTH